MIKYFDTNASMDLAPLQIKFTPLGPELPSPATTVFDKLIRGLLPRINRSPMMCNSNEQNYNVSKIRQNKLRTMIL